MPLRPEQRWPREVVVENDDGTVSLFADVEDIKGRIVRSRRADDVFGSSGCHGRFLCGADGGEPGAANAIVGRAAL